MEYLLGIIITTIKSKYTYLGQPQMASQRGLGIRLGISRMVTDRRWMFM